MGHASLKPRREFPGATHFRDRHGVRRWRYREKGFAAQLGRDYGSQEFIDRYEAALKHKKVKGGVGQDRTRPGTINALVAAFYNTPEFRATAPVTQYGYRLTLEQFRRGHGDKRVSKLQRRHVQEILTEKADTPAAAHLLLGLIRRLMDLAIVLEMRHDNPTTGVKPYKLKPGGHHTWKEDEIGSYYGLHKLGSIAYLAITLMLYTGVARGDAVNLGWGNVDQEKGRISYRRKKTRRVSEIVIDIPIHPDLAEALELCPRDADTFLVGSFGRQISAGRLGQLMRIWCDEVGLKQCSSHGLRKACARRLAEAGCTPHQIAAVTGHATLAEVERYTRAADRTGLADAGFEKLAKRS